MPHAAADVQSFNNFSYDATNHPLLSTTFAYAGTVVPEIVAQKSYWLLLGLHIALWLIWQFRLYEDIGGLERYGDADGPWAVSETALVTVNSMCVIFQAFYTRACTQRYSLLSNDLSAIFQAGHNANLWIKLVLETMPEYHQLVSRWSHLYMLVFVISLKHGEVTNAALFDELVRTRKLTPEERDCLTSYDNGQIQLVLGDWMRRGIEAGQARLPRGHHAKPPAMMRQCFQCLTEMDNTRFHLLQKIYLPVPYHYFQFLNLLVMLTSVMWAYGMSRYNSFFAPVTYMITSFFYFGVVTLGNMFAHPFGDDFVDFPVHFWLEGFLKNSQNFIHSNYPGGAENMRKAAFVHRRESELVTTKSGRLAPRRSSDVTSAESRMVPLRSHSDEDLDDDE